LYCFLQGDNKNVNTCDFCWYLSSACRFLQEFFLQNC